MAGIVTDGVGSGLQLGPLLDQLKAAEQKSLQAIQQQAISYTAKVSAYGTLKNLLDAFQTASTGLAASSLYQAVKAGSSASGVLSASAGASGAAGAYVVNVAQLAQAQSLATVGLASAKAAVGNGTVTITFGTISGGKLDAATGKYSAAAFAADADRSAASVTIDSTNNTLEGIRDAINKSPALGVTATIVNDGSSNPQRLVLTSNSSGETSSMQISVAGDPALQKLLAQDVGGGAQNMQETAAARNAKLTVNGIAVTSAGNVVQDAVQGVAMTLVASGSATVAVARDTTAAASAVNAFVTAYNNLQNGAATFTKYDGATKTGAALSGDSALRAIQSRIRSLLTTPQDASGDGPSSLTQIGVSLQKDGTLALDADKLTLALNTNPDGVGKLFVGSSGAGYATQMASLLKGFGETGGLLTLATAGVMKALGDLDKRYATMSARIDDTMARYKKQFDALDRIVTSLYATRDYLSQQFDALNKTK